MLLTAVLLLMAAGVVITLAASPPVAERLGLDSFHFARRQLAYLVPAAMILIATSLLDERQARRASLWCLDRRHRAHGRGDHGRAGDQGRAPLDRYRARSSIQPSEIVKPALVVMTAWLLSERARRPDMPGPLLAFVLFGIAVVLLVMQPDVGQTVVVVAVFAVMLFVYGIPWGMVGGLAALWRWRRLPSPTGRCRTCPRASTGSSVPNEGDTFQIDTALQAFHNGGLFGTGPGGGVAKRTLPDAHSDFIFSVVGEEFGLVAGAVLVGLFAFIVIRVLLRALNESEPFPVLALTGLVSVFGLQAVINMAVNLSLLPAKGLTLPFVSYGGSSLLSMAFTMGLILVFARRRPRAELPQTIVRATGREVMASRPRKGRSGTVVIAAGGTGGHLFPAQALAEELARRGYAVHLMTDHRVRDYGAKFPAEQIYDIPSATLALGQPWKLPLGSVNLVRGYNIARTILLYVKPVAIVGFGGYPSFPPVLAGVRLRVPTVIHEQNAVLGRANRAMSRFATAIASSFPTTANLNPALASKVVMTGNPVRTQVREVAGMPYEKPAADRPFRLLVFGGSQGAKFFADIMPDTVAEMPAAMRRRLKITLQCRAEDVERVRKAFDRLAVSHEVKAFFSDLPKRIGEAQLVLCRSGASTIAELGDHRQTRHTGAAAARPRQRPAAQRADVHRERRRLAAAAAGDCPRRSRRHHHQAALPGCRPRRGGCCGAARRRARRGRAAGRFGRRIGAPDER